MITKETAETLLSPYYGAFSRIVRAGWQGWWDLSPAQRARQDVRSQRCWTWCCMIDAARIEFTADPRVTIIDGTMTTFFIVEDSAAIRFKKLSASGSSSNVATQMQLDLRDPQRTIPGILADLPRLEVGYVPNSIETNFDAVLIAYPVGDAVAWTIEVTDDFGDSKVITDIEPVGPSDVGTRIRPVVPAVSMTATGTESE